ncbi:hypothetical protein [Variovorax sp. PBS-H4]|uniref:hypothetical protein n=1 Tax=Variovorax sp. PBS-H4 TaxID=434008 RepID=UPI001E3AA0CE|nr:hypothetical protein [Variovorax sp. PBS-H4]
MHLQMASKALRKVLDLLHRPKASVADPAGINQVVTFTDDLAWIVDSLHIQNVLLQMLPASQRDSDQAVETLSRILQCAFNLELADANARFDEGEDKAEGDALENVLNALAGLALGPLGQPRLKGSRDSNGRHLMEDRGGFTGRNTFYAVLQLIQQSELFKKAVAGEVSLGLVASATDLTQDARIDFGAFAALYGLTPFVFTSSTPDAFDAIAGRNWGVIYDDWQADRAALMAGATVDELHVTDQWLEDRALLLGRRSRFYGGNAGAGDNTLPASSHPSACSPRRTCP